MSLFAVAEHVTVETRHVGASEAHRFVVRSPHQVVRVEAIDKDEPGTIIRVKLLSGKMTEINFPQ